MSTPTKKSKTPKVIDHRGTLITVGGETVTIQQRLKKNSPYHSATEDQLLCYIAERKNCPGFRLFSEASQAMFNDIDSHTGPGERSVRNEEGLSPITQGTASLDIPELGEGGTEVKKGPIIKAGISAQRAWQDFLFATGMLVNDPDYWHAPIMWNGVETTFRFLFSMGVSNKLLAALKPEYSDQIRAAVCPSKILASYPNIALVIKDAYITIPRKDYKEAWRFVTISQVIPRYRLRREYLERLALEHVPNGVPIDTIGNVGKEGLTITSTEELPHLSPANVNVFSSGDGFQPDLTPDIEVPHVFLEVASREVSVEVVGI